ncbi:hypothetical protein LMG24235_03439 [Paraburkholderia sabiae]|nr:hypothetical protein LMG24235_03439 [Paraburkholderia sabiae]
MKGFVMPVTSLHAHQHAAPLAGCVESAQPGL